MTKLPFNIINIIVQLKQSPSQWVKSQQQGSDTHRQKGRHARAGFYMKRETAPTQVGSNAISTPPACLPY